MEEKKYTSKLESDFLDFIEDNAHRGSFAQNLGGYIRHGGELPEDTEECRSLLNRGIDLYLNAVEGRR